MRILRHISKACEMDSQLRIGLGARRGFEWRVRYGRHLPQDFYRAKMELRVDFRFGMIPAYKWKACIKEPFLNTTHEVKQ
jgi:hypothetical protein